MNTPEPERQQSIREFTQGCGTLRAQIEERRARHKAESITKKFVFAVL
jgi:hypothetical protein